MQIQEIKPSQTLELRSLILRPGFKPDECVYPGDTDLTTHHFGCIVDKQIVGIVSVYQRSTSKVGTGSGFQIRAMASHEAFRGMGVGLKLLRKAERVVLENRGTYLWANARTSALGFYQKAGFQVIGKEFDIKGVGPHFLIVRQVG